MSARAAATTRASRRQCSAVEEASWSSSESTPSACSAVSPPKPIMATRLTRRWKVEHRTDVAYRPPCPKRRAGDLRAAAAHEIVGVDRGNAPTGIGCPNSSLDWISGSPILNIQAEQRLAASGAHGADIAQ